MNSKESFLTPDYKQAIALSIILSRAGSLYLKNRDLTFEVQTKGKDGVCEERVRSIHYVNGWQFGWQVWFDNGGAFVTEPADREKLIDYILDNFEWPKEYGDRELLDDRNAIRLLNQCFIAQHGDLDEGDFDTIDSIRGRLALLRRVPDGERWPMPCDLVEGAYYHGAHPFKDGVIEANTPVPTKFSVCAHPSTHVALNGDGSVGMSVSGGPFFGIRPDDFEYVGEDTAELWTWGHAGRCANGGIRFMAKVNRWRIKEGTDY